MENTETSDTVLQLGLLLSAIVLRIKEKRLDNEPTARLRKALAEKGAETRDDAGKENNNS